MNTKSQPTINEILYFDKDNVKKTMRNHFVLLKNY